MSELITRATAKVYLVNEHPFAYAALTDLKPGIGMIQVHSDWGHYVAFWGSMGDRSVAQFVTNANSSYIQGCFRERMHYMQPKVSSFGLLANFMAHCWPRLKEEISKDLTEGKKNA